MNEIGPKDIVMAHERQKDYCRSWRALQAFMFSSNGFPLFLLYRDKCQESSKIIEQMKNNKREAE
jgi:hypothetical protein